MFYRQAGLSSRRKCLRFGPFGFFRFTIFFPALPPSLCRLCFAHLSSVSSCARLGESDSVSVSSPSLGGCLRQSALVGCRTSQPTPGQNHDEAVSVSAETFWVATIRQL